MKSNLAVALEEKQERSAKKLTENQKRLFAFLNRGEPPCDHERQLIEKHEDRMLAIFQGKIVPPYEVEIQPTSLCNLNCKHCFGKALTSKRLENKIGRKELEIIAERINEFRENEFQIETVKFCGTTGEPLVNHASLDGINIFKNLGKKVVYFTNGLWLDKLYKKRKYLDYVLDADDLRLSLDLGSEKTFFELKRKLGFNRIIKNIKELVEKRGQTKSKLNIIVGYVIGRKNYHEIVKATKLVKNLGVDEIRFRVDFTDPKGVRELSDVIIQELNKAKQYKNDKFKVVSEYSEREIEEDESVFHPGGRMCFNQHFWACVGPECNLYACGHRTYYEVESYGSLLEHSFRELWISKKRIENSKNLPDDYCKFCSPSSKRRNDFMTFLYSLKNE